VELKDVPYSHFCAKNNVLIYNYEPIQAPGACNGYRARLPNAWPFCLLETRNMSVNCISAEKTVIY